MPTPLAQRLRAARIRKGLSLRDLGKKLGVNRGYLSAAERGQNPLPRTPRLMRWARLLGLPPIDTAIEAWIEKAPPELRAELGRRCLPKGPSQG